MPVFLTASSPRLGSSAAARPRWQPRKISSPDMCHGWRAGGRLGPVLSWCIVSCYHQSTSELLGWLGWAAWLLSGHLITNIKR